MPVTQDDLDKVFDHHPPSNQDVVEAHEAIRRAAKAFAYNIIVLVPEGREQSMALTDCENAMMHANAGIARHQ
jgi:hypothetical protein